MICVNCLDVAKVDDVLYQKIYANTSGERRQRAERYHNSKDAKRCVLAEALLRFCLKEACGYAGQPVVQYYEHGKPFIKDLEEFAYNISHSGRWVVVAYAYNPSDVTKEKRVGVDVEKIRVFSGCERLAIRFFAKEEQEYIFSVKSDEERAARFTKIWTLKESYLKYLGSGLSERLESFGVDAVAGRIQDASGKTIVDVYTKSFCLEEYYLSVCGNDKETSMRIVGEQELQKYIGGHIS